MNGKEIIKVKNIVNSYTEWDLLEEVIVGKIEGSYIPQWHHSMGAVIPVQSQYLFKENGGTSFPIEYIEKASEELESLVKILLREGINVVRPDNYSHQNTFSNPYWEQSSGFYSAMPRDSMFVYGDEIIEVPMAWRSRYYEVFPYRNILKDYFKRGGRWTSAPKPELKDELYDSNHKNSEINCQFKSVINEVEPTFDAADFIKFGKDIVGQISHVTNNLGVEWLRRHLGDECKIHIIETEDVRRMHIDATIVPLAPGKLLVNSKVFKEAPSIFHDWEIIKAPEPCLSKTHPLFMSSPWVTINVLSIDEKRVIVEAGEYKLAELLSKRGFNVIPREFKYFHTFGGGFHCATLDIRRQGSNASYFS